LEGGSSFRFPPADGPAKLWGTFPNGILGVEFLRAPPLSGKAIEEASKSLDPDASAEEVTLRLIGGLHSINAKNLTGPEKRDGPGGALVCTWHLKRKHNQADIEIRVGKEDGNVKMIRLYPAPEDYLGEPKVTREEAAKLVEAMPGHERWFDPKRLCLEIRRQHADQRLVWSYYPARPSDGGLPRRYAVWDATTGEVLESDCLEGGTREKPYRNPAFHGPPGKDQLENAIKKWAAEIEARNSPKDRHPLFLMPGTNASLVRVDVPGGPAPTNAPDAKK